MTTRKLLPLLLATGMLGADVEPDEGPCNAYLSDCPRQECWAPIAGQDLVSLDPCFSVDMLSRLHHRTEKQLVLLRYRKKDEGTDLIIGAQLRPVIFQTWTNTTDKFGYLGRFPENSKGRNSSAADINDFTFSATYSPTSWAHVHWEFLNADDITFKHDARQGANQTHKVFAVIGDLNECPVYMSIGKWDVAFGAMYTVNPFSAPTSWHYFGALSSGISLGYVDHGLHLQGALVNGGRGIRVTDSNTKGRLNNFALNGSYEFCCWEDITVRLGGGFLFSTIYDGPVAEHTGPPSTGPRNSAWDINAEFTWRKLRLFAEHTATLREWPTSMARIRSISAGASYCWDCESLPFPLVTSFEYGQGFQGPSGSEWQSNRQLVFGFEARVKHNVRFMGEYVTTAGFAPLMDIAKPGVSVQSARQHVLLASALIVM